MAGKDENSGRKDEVSYGVRGQFVWFVIGFGWLTGTLWMLAGLFLCATVVGIPMGIACFRVGRFAYLPFGKELVPAEWLGEKRIPWTALMNFCWICLPGIVLALTHATVGLTLCCTIIGIPWGLAHFRLPGASWAPLGKRVVAKDYAAVLRTKYYEAKANAALGQGNGGTTVIVNNQAGGPQPGGNAP